MLELVGGFFLVGTLFILSIISRYKRCPANKILVVYGKTGSADRPNIYTGGGVYVFPIIQHYAYLVRSPLKVRAEVKRVRRKNGDWVDVSGAFTVAVGDTKLMMEAAAKRLLKQSNDQIIDLCKDVIKAQLRLVVGALASVEINDQKQLVDAIYVGVNEQLHTIGLQLLNVDLNEVRIKAGKVAGLVYRSSTEEQDTKVDAVNVELGSDQVDALLKGEVINLQIPDEARTIRILRRQHQVETTNSLINPL
jgi:flotillin